MSLLLTLLSSYCSQSPPCHCPYLETIIRLATASCKVCLRYSITLHDVDVAVGILEHCMNKDVGGSLDEEDEEEMQELEDEDGEDEMDEEDDEEKQAKKRYISNALSSTIQCTQFHNPMHSVPQSNAFCTC